MMQEFRSGRRAGAYIVLAFMLVIGRGNCAQGATSAPDQGGAAVEQDPTRTPNPSEAARYRERTEPQAQAAAAEGEVKPAAQEQAEPDLHQPAAQRMTAPDGTVLVQIHGGTLHMGPPEEGLHFTERHPEEPRLTVEVGDFRIGATLVTAEQFSEFLNSDYVARLGLRSDAYPFLVHVGEPLHRHANVEERPDGFQPRDGASHAPVNCATWLGAALYCERLSRKEGIVYRLPTEAEWEFAARGEQGRLWPWGDQEPGPQHGYRWGGKGTAQYRQEGTGPAFPQASTPEGVHGLLAHEEEWCVTRYQAAPTDQTVLDERPYFDDLLWWRAIRGLRQKRANLRNANIVAGILGLHGRSHQGRVWTRSGRLPLKGNAHFRICTDGTKAPRGDGREYPGDLGLVLAHEGRAREFLDPLLWHRVRLDREREAVGYDAALQRIKAIFGVPDETMTDQVESEVVTWLVYETRIMRDGQSLPCVFAVVDPPGDCLWAQILGEHSLRMPWPWNPTFWPQWDRMQRQRGRKDR